MRPAVAACAVLAALVFALPTAASARGCRHAGAQAGSATPAQLAHATVCLLNRQRVARGMRPLYADSSLATAAQRYVEYMVSTDHFAHLDEAGNDVVDRVLGADPSLAGRWRLMGENLGWGDYSSATPRSMVSAWMRSPAHRANILDRRYDEIGVGITRGAPMPGARDALTYATVFGRIPSRAGRARTARCIRKARKAAKHSRRAGSARIRRCRGR